MPVAQKSPTILSTPAPSALAAACSASWRCTASERSASISNAPQLLRSPGIGLAASHLPLTCPAKSTQAFLPGSRSARVKLLNGGSLDSSRVYAAGAAGAAALAVAAGSAGFWQAARLAAMASDNSRIFGVFT